MIIKVQGTDETVNSWRYYEAHEVKWCEERYDNCCREMQEVEVALIECEMFDNRKAANQSDIFARITFYDQNNKLRHVYTNTTAYLLNNEGKTIDRIN